MLIKIYEFNSNVDSQKSFIEQMVKAEVNGISDEMKRETETRK